MHYIFLPVMNSLYFTCIHLLNLYMKSLQLEADVAFPNGSRAVNHATFHFLPTPRCTIYHKIKATRKTHLNPAVNHDIDCR